MRKDNTPLDDDVEDAVTARIVERRDVGWLVILRLSVGYC